MSIIQVEHLTKDYGHNRGVFDVTFNVKQGEFYGFLGPNGAGKSTTIRHLMGFSKPQKGNAKVLGKDSSTQHHEIQRDVGYLPGEIALPEFLTGTQFIAMMAELRGMKDMSYTNGLIKRFELEASGGLKRMSLGMKRKLAVVTAFMHDPAVLILDEPTSGLDPVMQEVFIDFVKEEKRRGKTILLSSHIFAEIDSTCDRISIIKDGRLVSTFVADEIKNASRKEWKIEFNTKEDFKRFCADDRLKVVYTKEETNQAQVVIYSENTNAMVATLADYSVKFFSEIKFTLEDYFMEFYDKNKAVKGGA
ncbi:MAG: ATP-binding cassette domain-containing protein [Defluviitaleaceae bacterium]|nr:ATP-binding cassette domain-containing protein [Defluviitaleaceae bacterium]